MKTKILATYFETNNEFTDDLIVVLSVDMDMIRNIHNVLLENNFSTISVIEGFKTIVFKPEQLPYYIQPFIYSQGFVEMYNSVFDENPVLDEKIEITSLNISRNNIRVIGYGHYSGIPFESKPFFENEFEQFNLSYQFEIKKVITLQGDETINFYDENSLDDTLKEENSCFIKRTFTNEKERIAYLNGLNDADGWNSILTENDFSENTWIFFDRENFRFIKRLSETIFSIKQFKKDLLVDADLFSQEQFISEKFEDSKYWILRDINVLGEENYLSILTQKFGPESNLYKNDYVLAANAIFEILLQKSESEIWTCTDPDNLQFQRNGSFEFKEFDRFSYPNEFKEIVDGVDTLKTPIELIPYWNNSNYWIIDTIDFKEYSIEKVFSLCSSYYSKEELSELIEDSNSGGWEIIAECIFEQESGLY